MLTIRKGKLRKSYKFLVNFETFIFKKAVGDQHDDFAGRNDLMEVNEYTQTTQTLIN